MTALFPSLVAGLLGLAVGALLVPITRRQLTDAVTRSSTRPGTPEGHPNPVPVAPTAAAAVPAAATATLETASGPDQEGGVSVSPRHRVALVVVSGLVPAYVVHGVGWSPVTVPPLLLMLGLIQLAYCDLMRRLLPKTMVWTLSVVVMTSALVVAAAVHEWDRLVVAWLGGLALFVLFFLVNLANPRWLAFGDVRLSLVLGFGLAWVSPVALLEGFFVANLVGAAVGLALIALHRAEHGSAVPFGLYLALGTGLVLLTWS